MLRSASFEKSEQKPRLKYLLEEQSELLLKILFVLEAKLYFSSKPYSSFLFFFKSN